jgi:DNA-binding response OmpR family regulator
VGTKPPDAVIAELQARPLSGRVAPDVASLEVRLNGIFVPTDQPLAPGTVVTLQLKLSQAGPHLTALARVVQVVSPDPTVAGREPGMRMEFVDVWGERASAQLTSFLREAATTTAPPAAMRLSGTLVLVVDDDAHYRELAAQVMRESGFEVLTAANGIEGLSLALRHQPSLVITDVTMPGMDGWQFLRMVRARPALRRTPVIFLTQLTQDSERLRGYQLGVDDYVAKPFTGVELIARVERVLERAYAAEQAAADGMRGDLSKVPLASLLQLAELERRTAMLQLLRPGESAIVHVRDGAVVRIDLAEAHDRLEGMARLFHLLDWTEGRFELTTSAAAVEETLDLRTSFVLLEYARQYDEALR